MWYSSGPNSISAWSRVTVSARNWLGSVKLTENAHVYHAMCGVGFTEPEGLQDLRNLTGLACGNESRNGLHILGSTDTHFVFLKRVA